MTTMSSSNATDSGPREVTLLVHIAAASGAKDDARFRAQAEAYLAFEPFSSIKHTVTATRSTPQEVLALSPSGPGTPLHPARSALEFNAQHNGGHAEAGKPLHGGTTSDGGGGHGGTTTVTGPPPKNPAHPPLRAVPQTAGHVASLQPRHGGTTSVMGLQRRPTHSPLPPPPQTPDFVASVQPVVGNRGRSTTTGSQISLPKRPSTPTIDSARKRRRREEKVAEEGRRPHALRPQLPEGNVFGREKVAPLPPVPAPQPNRPSHHQRPQERLTRHNIQLQLPPSSSMRSSGTSAMSTAAPNKMVQKDRPGSNSKESRPSQGAGEVHSQDDLQSTWTSCTSSPALVLEPAAAAAPAPLITDSVAAASASASAAATATSAPTNNSMSDASGDSFTSEDSQDGPPPNIMRLHSPGSIRDPAYRHFANKYVTPWLTALATALDADQHPRFRPVHATREPRGFERGCWRFRLSRSVFSDEQLRQMWEWLQVFVEEGRAGLDVTVVMDTHGHDFLGTGQSGGHDSAEAGGTVATGENDGRGGGGGASGRTGSSTAAEGQASRTTGTVPAAEPVPSAGQRSHHPTPKVHASSSSSTSSSSSFFSLEPETAGTTPPKIDNANKEAQAKGKGKDEDQAKAKTKDGGNGGDDGVEEEEEEQEQFLDLLIFCWGSVARYIYCVVWLASDRRIKLKYPGWRDGHSHCGVWVDASAQPVLTM